MPPFTMPIRVRHTKAVIWALKALARLAPLLGKDLTVRLANKAARLLVAEYQYRGKWHQIPINPKITDL